MSVGYKTVDTPEYWQELAACMTRALMTNGMTTRGDILVQILDQPDAERHPIAWHVPSMSDIVINAHKIPGMLALRETYTKAQLMETMKEHLSYADGASWANYLDGSGEDEDDDTWGWFTGIGDARSLYTVAARIRGALVHEAAHSKWSHWMLDEWWRECDPKLARVIARMEEVRIESMQADVRYDFRRSMRQSARMLLPTREEIEALKVETENGFGVAVESIAFEGILTLGRYDRGILHRYEVREMAALVEDVVGFDRYWKMRSIWTRFADIENPVPEYMKSLAQEWIDLFPEEEKPLELEGLLGMMADAVEEMGKEVEKWSGNEADTHAPDAPADPATESEEVFKERKTPKKDEKNDEIHHGYTRGGGADFERRPPSDEDKQAATRLARRLERLSVTARSRTKRHSAAPPGRLSGRGALRQSAERAQGMMSTAEPWTQVVRKTTTRPQLKVGIETDVSGSMSWATEFVARFAWVVNKAVRHINGISASVVFGERAEPVLGVKDKLDMVVYRDACDGSEAFNSATAALDGQLGLSTPGSARILVVVSDGHFVAQGEMPAAAKWVEKLVTSGCAVVWVTPYGEGSKHAGFPCVPKGAKILTVGDRRAVTPMDMVNVLADAIAEQLSSAAR